MRDLEELSEFARNRTRHETLVLCTLVRKQGSSYRAVGAKKLVAREATCGTLSGGCMEGAIERAAREGMKRLPFLESFSTMSDEDRLMGYQTGCQGRIEVLFESLRMDAGADEISGVLAYGSPRLSPVVTVSLRPESLGRRTLGRPSADDRAMTFVDEWIEPLHLTVIGCGPDSEPYVELAAALGWTIRFIDYRGDLVARFHTRVPGRPLHVRHAPASEIPSHVGAGPRAAVILATHNYEADLEILRGLSHHSFGYVACLGPRARWERLKRDLHDFHDIEISSAWEAKLHAPAGVYPRGRSSSEIALSVVAQIQGALNEESVAALPTAPNVWSVILAAGEGRRFGGPKALADFHGSTLLARAVTTAAAALDALVAPPAPLRADRPAGPQADDESFRSRIVVVTGAHRAAVQMELAAFPACVEAFNQEWQSGLGTSIACGLAAVRERDPGATIALIVPVDQPLITSDHLVALAELASATDRCAMTSDERRSGPPAALPRRLFALSDSSKADQGLKSILRPADVICIDAPRELRDADHPAELARLATEPRSESRSEPAAASDAHFQRRSDISVPPA